MKRLEFHEELAADDGRLNVRVDVGEVTIRAHAKPYVAVTAWVQNVDVSVWRQGETVYVRAALGDDGPAPRQRARAELHISVPATCSVWARTVTGSLTISDVTGPVVTQVDTGATWLASLGSSVQAATTSGKITYTGSLAATGHSFRATTGKLLFRLDPLADVSIAARTTTGRIVTDVPMHDLVETRSLAGARLRGTLGSGKAALQARVVTGSVHLQVQKTVEEEV